MNRRRRRRATKRFFLLIVILLAVAIAVMLFFTQCKASGEKENGSIFDILKKPTPTPMATLAPTPTPMPTPNAHVSALPSKFGIESAMNLGGSDIQSFNRDEPLDFGEGNTYPQLEGIVTFRGDHWRQGATYGTADVQNKTLTLLWTKETASLPRTDSDKSWTGNGWTGQPMIVKWPEATRKVMNLFEEKKNKNGLIEVIYPSLDGFVHFVDLEDGKKTRESIDIGLPFKGAGSLDPRGYPLLYLGAGDAVPAHHGRQAMVQEFFIYSLIDGKRLYAFGKTPDPYAQREWHAYDSSALIHAATDTLIEPGENGILYSVKLNSAFDANAGTVSINPGEMLKFRYTTQRARDGMQNDTYWLGMESSAAMWHHWLYIADNCGTLLCIDTNTMQVVWAQDTLDDSNSTPVLEVENGKPVLYVSTSLHWTKDANNKGTIPIWKIDGMTGEILWQRDYNCNTVSGVSGGVEGTGLLGKQDISDLIIYPLARTPDTSNGKLVALDKKTSEEKWVYDMQYYAWSSPVAVYDKNGKAYVIICDSQGRMDLLDGKTGTLLFSLELGTNIEASPAVYGDMIVVGTRGQKICGVQIQ